MIASYGGMAILSRYSEATHLNQHSRCGVNYAAVPNAAYEAILRGLVDKPWLSYKCHTK